MEANRKFKPKPKQKNSQDNQNQNFRNQNNENNGTNNNKRKFNKKQQDQKKAQGKNQENQFDNPNNPNEQDNDEEVEEQTKDQNPHDGKAKKKMRVYEKPIVNVDEDLVYRMFVKVEIKKDLLFDLAFDFKNPALRKPFKDLIEKVLSQKEDLLKSAYESHEIIKKFTNYQTRMPRQILKKYMSILIQNKDVIKKKLYYKEADKIFAKIPTNYLVDFILLYDIQIKDQVQLQDILNELGQNKCLEDALKLIQHVKLKVNLQKWYKSLLKQLINTKNYRQLRRVIKQLKVSQEIVKELRAQMLNRTASYYLHGQGWQYLQEIFEPYPQIIAHVLNQACRDLKRLQKKNNLQGAASICLRNKQVLNKLNKQAKLIIEAQIGKMMRQKGSQLVNNLVVHKFEPSDQNYFSFQEFQLFQKHIYWVDQKTPQSVLKQVRNKILSANYIGIDTESTLARTPIDTEQQTLSLIQVSTYEQVFLFDPYKINHPEIYQCFKAYFQDKDKKIVGHTIQDDISLVAKILKLKNKPNCKVIDIRDQVVKMKVNCKHGLKSISQHYLGKQICKKYTCTNWQRRPLNKNQIHYAALDAFIVLKIWQKIVEQKTSKKNQQTSNLQKDKDQSSKNLQQNKSIAKQKQKYTELIQQSHKVQSLKK